jgi:predicted RNA-binding protein with TRAM domain
MMQNNRQFGPTPVKEGEIRELEIINIGEKGDGIARVEGFIIIVPETKRGKRYHVEITAIRGRVGFGKIIAPAKA